MIFHFDFAYQGWEQGHGASSVWPFIPFDRKSAQPRFLVGASSWNCNPTRLKIAFRSVGRNNLTRTMTAACINFPCGNSLSTLTLRDSSVAKNLLLMSLLDSLCFDFVARARIAALNLNWYVIEDCPLVKDVSEANVFALAARAARLTFVNRRFAPQWLWLKHRHPMFSDVEWKRLWAVTEVDRLRLRVEIEALATDLYGLAPDDFDWILRDDPSDPKGFYRVDRTLPFRERLTCLAGAAFRALRDGKWSAESAAKLSDEEFFEILGIPEMTSEKAAKALGLPEPLIYKRKGCHKWEPEKFTEDDPRHGWTWDDCKKDAIALLGSDEAVQAYIEGNPQANDDEVSPPPHGGTDLFGRPIKPKENQGKLF
jgi:hypothetical protein